MKGMHKVRFLKEFNLGKHSGEGIQREQSCWMSWGVMGTFSQRAPPDTPAAPALPASNLLPRVLPALSLLSTKAWKEPVESLLCYLCFPQPAAPIPSPHSKQSSGWDEHRVPFSEECRLGKAEIAQHWYNRTGCVFVFERFQAQTN